MKCYLADANILLRFLLDDDPQQSPAAQRFFSECAQGLHGILIPDLCIAEVVYVLSGKLKRDRKRLSEVLSRLLQQPGIVLDPGSVVMDALIRFSKSKADFSDCFFAAKSLALGLELASWDRDYDRFGDVSRYEPPERKT